MSIQEPPEPLAHPSMLSEPTASFPSVEIRSRVGQKRLGLGLFITGFGTIFASTALNNVLLAAKLAILDEADKVALLGTATAIYAVVGAISIVLWGAASDLIRSRLGRRTPIVLIGGIGGGLSLFLVASADAVVLILIAYSLFAVFASAVSAAVLAVFPDRVPRNKRGTASAVYGGSQVLGGSIAGIVASRFISAPSGPLFVCALAFFIAPVVFALIAPDFSNKDEHRVKLDRAGLIDSIKFPRFTGAEDFYWALGGRFALFLGSSMIVAFTLYILTDFMGLSNAEAGNYVLVGGLLSLAAIVLATFLGGPISDRIGRRKVPIFIAGLIMSASIGFLILAPNPTGFLVYQAMWGFGTGLFLSIDAALMTEVLPSETSRGKDIAILNTANSIPNAIGPIVTSLMIGAGTGYPPVFIVGFIISVIGAFTIFRIRSVR